MSYDLLFATSYFPTTISHISIFFLCVFLRVLSLLFTHSMVQSPSWAANWFAASQEIPLFHGTRRFITSLTSVRHLSLSWASPIQSIYPHPVSWRSVLILSTHLRLCLPSGLLPSGFPTKTLYNPSPHPYGPHVQPISFFSILSPAQYWVRSTELVC